MGDLVQAQYGDEEWPELAERMYERVEVLGRGSFGVVWMARRVTKPEDEFDDEYVALKNILIKEEKGRVYAQREIAILQELHHPNVIRLIRAFPVFRSSSQLVALQMARGPNLQYLVTKRGALGLPLSRLVARHLIAAVSYLHGRAVIHRDIKPTNCILENTQLAAQDIYNWVGDDIIWSDSQEAEHVVETGKYKLMIVDFGFARALEEGEIYAQPKKMRGSICNENALSIGEIAKLVTDEDDGADDDHGAEVVIQQIRKLSFAPPQDFGPTETSPKALSINKRLSAVSLAVPFVVKEENGGEDSETNMADPIYNDIGLYDEGGDEDYSSNGVRMDGHVRRQRAALTRQSTARTKFRSMSALGTKAYAAPEIKNQLRNKTAADLTLTKVALTDCVADYGMIVDAYSVGWTLRVVFTGIPPNVSISQYLRKVTSVQDQVGDTGCRCFKRSPPPRKPLKVRDVSELPKDAAMMLFMMTKSNPDERMTVREAQNHPYICGVDKPYELPQGDIPSKHGDPVVPLSCATSFSMSHSNRGADEND